MKVKIGDAWFDSSEVPICIKLTEQDKINIVNMSPEAKKYAVFPDIESISKEEMLEWMRDES